MKKFPILKRLGLRSVKKITKSVCLTRVVSIRKAIKNGKIEGKDRVFRARKSASWYLWKSRNISKKAA